MSSSSPSPLAIAHELRKASDISCPSRALREKDEGGCQSLNTAVPLRPRTTNMDDLAKRAGSSPRFLFDIAAEAVSHALTKAKTTSKS